MEYQRIRKDRSKIIGIPVSDSEKDIIVKAAVLSDRTLSDYCRYILVEASSKIVVGD